MSETNKKGCFFWGCLTFVIICLIVALVVFLGYRMVRDKAYEYTSEKPVPLEQVEYTPNEAEEVDNRITAFLEKIKKGESSVKETFTDRDINIFIDSGKAASELKDRIIVKFVDNKIKGSVNIPLKDVPIVDGRYLAGDAEFDVTCENGLLIITLKSMLVNGQKLPEEFMQNLQKENLAADLYKDPEKAKALRRLKTVKMENNKLLIEVGPEK